MLVRAGALGGGDDRLGRRVRPEAGDVLGDRAVEQLDVLGQVADMRPSASGSHWSRVAPSRRTSPRRVGHTPTRARARVDLPEALGPIRPRPWPACIWKRDALHDRQLRARRADIDVLHDRGVRRRRRQAEAAVLRRHERQDVLRGGDSPGGREMKPFQFATAISIGASARDIRIEAGDHRAAGHLALDDEIGAEAEDRGLQHHAEDLGEGADAARRVAGAQAVVDVAWR